MLSGLGEVTHPLNPNAWESGVVGLWIPGHPRLQSKGPVPKPNPNQNDNEWWGCIYTAIRLLMALTSFSLLWSHIRSNPSHVPHKLYSCSFPSMRLKHLLLNTYTYIKIMSVQGSIGEWCLLLHFCSSVALRLGALGIDGVQCTSWLCLLSVVEHGASSSVSLEGLL